MKKANHDLAEVWEWSILNSVNLIYRHINESVI